MVLYEIASKSDSMVEWFESWRGNLSVGGSNLAGGIEFFLLKYIQAKNKTNIQTSILQDGLMAEWLSHSSSE